MAKPTVDVVELSCSDYPAFSHIQTASFENPWPWEIVQHWRQKEMVFTMHLIFF